MKLFRVLIRRFIRILIKFFPTRIARLNYIFQTELDTFSKTALTKFLIEVSKKNSPLTKEDVVFELARVGKLQRKVLNEFLVHLFGERKMDFMKLLLDSGKLGHEDICTFHRIRISQYFHDGRFPAEDVFTFYASISKNDWLKASVLQLTLHQAIQEDKVELMLNILQSLPTHLMKSIRNATLLGTCRLLLKHNKLTSCRNILQLKFRYASNPEKLYFYEVAKKAFGPQHEERLDDWRNILSEIQEIYKSRQDLDGVDFQRIFLDPLQRISVNPQTDFMNIRMDLEERTVLLEKIEECLLNGKPLSLIRLGDGEAYAYPPPQLHKIDSEMFSEDNRVRELMWWGSHPSEETRREIQKGVRKAVKNTDILGVPSVYRLLRDLSTRTKHFGQQRSMRGLAVVMTHLHDTIPTTNRILTEERSHQILFDAPTAAALADKSRKVIFVTCWPHEKLSLHTSTPVETINISPHTRVQGAAGRGYDLAPLWSNFNEINQGISNKASPHTLVLIAAGIIGKIFVNTAKSQGAVALDIGAMADYYVGQKSRSVADIV